MTSERLPKTTLEFSREFATADERRSTADLRAGSVHEHPSYVETDDKRIWTTRVAVAKGSQETETSHG